MISSAWCLLVQISEICPELTAEDKVAKADRMLLFEVVPVNPGVLYEFLKNITVRSTGKGQRFFGGRMKEG